MDLIFAYGAGLLTLINPCVLPILPVVLASALQSGRSGPALLALGMSASFVVLGMSISVLGRSLGIDEAMVSRAGAVLMICFGLVLLVPRLSESFATATAGFAARADAGIDELDRAHPGGQFLAGALLGAVWSPCIGPTLGGAISLASQGESLIFATLIMVFFALGVSTVLLALAYGAQAAIRSRRDRMMRLAQIARPVLGAVFVLTGLAILADFQHIVEIWALDHLPDWLIDLSVSL